MKTYKTSEVARIVGIHPNTVRLYEEYGLIPKPRRLNNGYRVFTDLHVEQFRLARAAMKVEVMQNGLRKTAVNIVKTAAAGDFDSAIALAKGYLRQIKTEQRNAEDAIIAVRQILSGDDSGLETPGLFLRRQAADYLQVTVDTLRNWEMNGLLRVRRRQNGYRVYSSEDIKRLRIIRSLRTANYSLISILRMLRALSRDPNVSIREAIDSPGEDEDILSACDHLLTSLSDAEKRAGEVLERLQNMKRRF